MDTNSQKQPPKEIYQNECYECFSIILKVGGRIFLKINFLIDTTQPTFQRRINEKKKIKKNKNKKNKKK